MTLINYQEPDKKRAAVCGLFCPSCSLFIGSNEDPEMLQQLAEKRQCSVEDLKCHGCRSEQLSFFCREKCTMKQCAAEKEIDFCGECPEYPCDELQSFQALMPHRIELWESHQRIQDVGYEKWYLEKLEHYACPECHTINQIYSSSCRKCGNSPSSNYFDRHQAEIHSYLAKQQNNPKF